MLNSLMRGATRVRARACARRSIASCSLNATPTLLDGGAEERLQELAELERDAGRNSPKEGRTLPDTPIYCSSYAI